MTLLLWNLSPVVSFVSCLASILSTGQKEKKKQWIGLTASVLHSFVFNKFAALCVRLLPSQVGCPQVPCAGSPLPHLGGASSLFSSPRTHNRNWPPSTTLGQPWSGTRDKRYLSLSLTGAVAKTEPVSQINFNSKQSSGKFIGGKDDFIHQFETNPGGCVIDILHWHL